jgi:hypothetical protein
MIIPKNITSNYVSREVLKMKFRSMSPAAMSVVMFVLTETKNELSRFHAYLSGLPKSFDEYPICF